MMKITTHLKGIFLCLLAMTSISAKAYDVEVDGIYYYLNSSTMTATVTCRTTSYNSYSGVVNIPETITVGDATYSVTAIGGSAFRNCTGLSEITLPTTIISIANYAFDGCSSLSSIEIPDGVSAVANYMFRACTSLKSIKLSVRTANIGYYAFRGCTSLVSIDFPLSVATIQDYAFYGCSSLESITALDGIQYIANYAFSGCTNLSEINASDDFKITYYDKFSDTAWRKNMPDGEIYIGSTLMGYKGDAQLDTLIVKDGTTAIRGQAFYSYSNLRSVTLPNTLVTIGDYAFAYCTGLTSINIPASVTIIGTSAFRGCTNLTELTIVDDLLAMSINAFMGTAWYNNLPDGLLYFGSVLSGYKGNRPTGMIEVKKGTTAIGNAAFSGCSGITSVSFPSTLQHIGEQSFANCTNIQEVHISDLDAWCRIKFEDGRSNPTFYSTSLTLNGELVTEVVIPEDVTEVGFAQFKGVTTIKSVKLHEGIKKLHETCFQGCLSLSEINFPNSITFVGAAFHGCTSLTTDIVLGNKVDTIDAVAFYQCENIPSVTLPASLKYLGDRSFGSCLGLKKIISYVEDPESLEPKEFTRMPFDNFSSNGFRLDDQPIYKQATLYVPKGTVDAYKRSLIFGQFENILEMDAEPDLKGDVNGDGEVGIGDIITVTNVMAGDGTEETIQRADVNGDGEVGIGDIISITNIMAGE